jgi:uncharacterized protein HemY
MLGWEVGVTTDALGRLSFTNSDFFRAENHLEAAIHE